MKQRNENIMGACVNYNNTMQTTKNGKSSISNITIICSVSMLGKHLKMTVINLTSLSIVWLIFTLRIFKVEMVASAHHSIPTSIRWSLVTSSCWLRSKKPKTFSVGAEIRWMAVVWNWWGKLLCRRSICKLGALSTNTSSMSTSRKQQP